VNQHSDLIRASIASAGNDFRLGANEAPPAIISVFIGKYLTEVLEEVEQRVKTGKFSEQDEQMLRLDIHNKIPDLMMDNTDRNRTSPFAFTGNKFEVRAVGSSQNCSSTMTVLNTIMADQLIKFKEEVDALIKKGENREVAILHVLKKYITSSKRILFEGNNYSKEWEIEARKRGLNNIKNTPLALDSYTKKDVLDLFERNKVFNHVEMHARYEIELEKYIKKVQIESRILGELALTYIVPVAISYQNELLNNLKGLNEIGISKKLTESQKGVITEISEHINVIQAKTEDMVEARKKANNIEDSKKKAIAYCDAVKPFFEEIRYHIDKLEMMVDDRLWPVPKYREMLLLR
jgi:glutamine synthetase